MTEENQEFQSPQGFEGSLGPQNSQSASNSQVEEAASKSINDAVVAHVSGILRPTLQDNDFLQSFVRIGIDESPDTRHISADTMTKRDISKLGANILSQRKMSRGWNESKDKGQRRPSVRFTIESLDNEIEVEKSKKKRRRKSDVAHRQEEIYTDKDRAAAVNMGSRDIKQSLKMKRRQDRSRDLQIPEEAEPGSLLALGNRELRCGNLKIALNCIDKALELSPNDKNALIARSKCHLLLGEPQKALQDAEAAIRGKLKDPKNARAIYYKAEALYHLGDFELSLVFYYRGIRIRPEFDQFRLGVQKAKEAIQNILGKNAIPIYEHVKKSGSSAKGSQKTVRPKTCTPSSKTSSFTENNSSGTESSMKKEIKEKKRVRPLTAKKMSSEPNLLGQLNVDKIYLQNLLNCPLLSDRGSWRPPPYDPQAHAFFLYQQVVTVDRERKHELVGRMVGAAKFHDLVTLILHEFLL